MLVLSTRIVAVGALDRAKILPCQSLPCHLFCHALMYVHVCSTYMCTMYTCTCTCTVPVNESLRLMIVGRWSNGASIGILTPSQFHFVSVPSFFFSVPFFRVTSRLARGIGERFFWSGGWSTSATNGSV